MKKLLWWLKRCVCCWDENLELVDKDTLTFYEGKEEWDNLWRAVSDLHMTGLFSDVNDGAFPGLDSFVRSAQSGFAQNPGQLGSGGIYDGPE